MSKKELDNKILKSLSNNKRNQLYRLVITSILEYVSDNESKQIAESAHQESQIEYFGHIIEDKKFKIKQDDEGAEYYVY